MRFRDCQLPYHTMHDCRSNRSSRITWALALLVVWPIAAAGGQDKSDTSLGTLDCVINPSVVADLGSAVPGVLSAVKVDRSDAVAAGDLVAELEAGVETAAVELARARARTTTEIELRRVNAAFGWRQHKRSADLFKRQVISTNDQDQRETEARLAQLELRQAQDQHHLAELELLRSEEILARRAIRSPISGVVMERFKVVGEYVEDQPVVRVAQLDPLHVDVIVPVGLLGKVRKGMRAEVRSEVVDNAPWSATVTQVDRVADVASGTYGVRLTLPNPDHRIPAGLRCRVTFIDGLTVSSDQNEPPVSHLQFSQTAVDRAPSNKVTKMEATTTDPAIATPAIEPAGSLGKCRRVGPFDSEAAAQHQGDALRATGLDIAIESRKASVVVGHRVLSAEMPSREAAEKLVARLRNAGIRDLHLPSGRAPLRVALGLYRDPRVAQHRVNVLHAKGFDVQMSPWHNSVPQYFLKVRGTPDQAARDLLAGLPASMRKEVPESGCEHLARR